MNFKSAILGFLFIVYSSSFIVANAQQNPGEVVIDAGVGYSPFFDGAFASFIGYPIAYDAHEEDWSITRATPCFAITADCGLAKWFSAGVAMSYQNETVDNNVFSTNDDITRLNFSGRLLFHLNPGNLNWDLYMGIRAGFSDYIDSPTTYGSAAYSPTYGPIYFIEKPDQVVSSLQAILFAFRGYFNDFLGIHGELAFGAPYLAEAGLTFRINSKKAVQQPTTPATAK